MRILRHFRKRKPQHGIRRPLRHNVIFSKISELFYDLFVTEPEEEEYIDSAGEDGKEAGSRMAGVLPARAVRPLDAVIFVPRAYSDARRAVDAMEKDL